MTAAYSLGPATDAGLAERITDETTLVHAAVEGVVGTTAPADHQHTVADLSTTGTRSASTYLNGLGEFTSPSGGSTDPEVVRDTIAAALVAGAGVTITHDDALDTITISSTGGSTDAETVRDVIGTALTAGASVSITVNDVGDTITVAVTAASDTAAGAVELATVAETTTGTDTARAVTPAGVKAVADTKANRSFTDKAVPGAYTLVLSDADDVLLRSTSASAVTWTFPQNSAVAIPVGASGLIYLEAAGQVTFAAGTGATLTSRGSVFKSAGQEALVTWVKVGTNKFVISGDLTA